MFPFFVCFCFLLVCVACLCAFGGLIDGDNWVSPVYARLQRRFVRFVGGNVEEKLEELEVDAFESMLRKVAITVEPFYHLSNEGHSKDPNEYPAWNLTDFILKIIRNSISCIDVMSVESKVVRMFQNEMSKEMRQLSKALEKIVDTGDVELATKDVNVVESMLNIGHAMPCFGLLCLG